MLGCLGLNWREGLEVWNLLAWEGAQPSQEGNAAERRASEKHGVEGMAVGIMLLASFPLP